MSYENKVYAIVIGIFLVTVAIAIYLDRKNNRL